MRFPARRLGDVLVPVVASDGVTDLLGGALLAFGLTDAVLSASKISGELQEMIRACPGHLGEVIDEVLSNLATESRVPFT